MTINTLRELKEELILEKNITIKYCKDNDYNKGKIDMIDEILEILGEIT